MNALQARVANHRLTPHTIYKLMARHYQLAIAAADSGIVDPCGNGVAPRPLKTPVIRRLVNNQNHYAFSAVVDSVDTSLGTVPATAPTDSMVGSEERVKEYIRRHERGEQLFHPADSNPTIGTGDWSQ